MEVSGIWVLFMPELFYYNLHRNKDYFHPIFRVSYTSVSQVKRFYYIFFHKGSSQWLLRPEKFPLAEINFHILYNEYSEAFILRIINEQNDSFIFIHFFFEIKIFIMLQKELDWITVCLAAFEPTNLTNQNFLSALL